MRRRSFLPVIAIILFVGLGYWLLNSSRDQEFLASTLPLCNSLDDPSNPKELIITNKNSLTQFQAIYYDITGTSLEEITTSIRNNTMVPGGSAATTQWSHERRQTESGDAIVHNVTVFLPRWRSGSSPADVGEEWERFSTNLCQHEINHLRIFEKAINKIECESPAELTRIISITNEISDQYDNLTDHGRLEGASLGSKVERRDFSSWLDSALIKIDAVDC